MSHAFKIKNGLIINESQEITGVTTSVNAVNNYTLVTEGAVKSYASPSGNLSGATNYIPVFNSSSAVTSSIIYQSGTSIGINTLVPSATLDIHGIGITSATTTFQTANSSGTSTFSITDDGTVTNYGNFNVNQSTIGVGTVSNTSGSTVVSGTNTLFLTTFLPGNYITISGQTLTVNEVLSNTVLTTNTAITSGNTNVQYTITGGNRFNVAADVRGAVSVYSLGGPTERIITTSGSTGTLQNYLQVDGNYITDTTLLMDLVNPGYWVNGSFTGSTLSAVEGQEYIGSYYRYIFQNSIFTRYLFADYPANIYTDTATATTSINNVYVNATGDTNIYLPVANTMVFNKIEIKNINSGTTTLVATSPSSIDGESSISLPQWFSLTLKIYNNNYYIS